MREVLLLSTSFLCDSEDTIAGRAQTEYNGHGIHNQTMLKPHAHLREQQWHKMPTIKGDKSAIIM